MSAWFHNSPAHSLRLSLHFCNSFSVNCRKIGRKWTEKINNTVHKARIGTFIFSIFFLLVFLFTLIVVVVFRSILLRLVLNLEKPNFFGETEKNFWQKANHFPRISQGRQMLSKNRWRTRMINGLVDKIKFDHRRTLKKTFFTFSSFYFVFRFVARLIIINYYYYYFQLLSIR